MPPAGDNLATATTTTTTRPAQACSVEYDRSLTEMCLSPTSPTCTSGLAPHLSVLPLLQPAPQAGARTSSFYLPPHCHQATRCSRCCSLAPGMARPRSLGAEPSCIRHEVHQAQVGMSDKVRRMEWSRPTEASVMRQHTYTLWKDTSKGVGRVLLMPGSKGRSTRIQGREHPDPRAGAPGSKGRSTWIQGQEHPDPRARAPGSKGKSTRIQEQEHPDPRAGAPGSKDRRLSNIVHSDFCCRLGWCV